MIPGTRLLLMRGRFAPIPSDGAMSAPVLEALALLALPQWSIAARRWVAWLPHVEIDADFRQRYGCYRVKNLASIRAITCRIV